MLVERQSGEPNSLQVSKTASIELPVHALHPASSWQPPLSKASYSSPQPTELGTRQFLKRSRPQEETDRIGESVSRKKRRLRHDLVTSRLSRPYATPATHIARGAWRLGVWARQRLSGGLLLRKGAILNSIAKNKKKAVPESTKKKERGEAGAGFKYGNTCCLVSPMADNSRSQSLPLQTSLKSRSVFTSSDYDVFDDEENESIEDEEEEEDDENENVGGSRPVYSDFRMLSSPDSDEEFGDASYSFDTLDTSYHLGIDQGEKAIHLVMENEKQDEVSVAPMTPTTQNPSFSGPVAIGV